ncbi:MAG: hypothetical protein E4G90_10730 [Gemmatimonadales bacterium]|nr:MAG: hypothetical protein E4G90_10730 [Gemmatimonadales bacterium]
MLTKLKSSPSISVPPSSRGHNSYEALTATREGLLKLRDLHSSSLWDSLLDLLWAERHFHLEGLAETDDETEAKTHRIVLRYLKHLTEEIPEAVRDRLEVLDTERSHPRETLDPDSGGTPYMESDGDSIETEAV